MIGEEGVRLTVTIELSATAKGNLVASGLGHLVCVDGAASAVEKADMLSAAVFLAAGADKGAPVSLDQVVNLNNYLGVNEWTYTASGSVRTLNVTYFQFKDAAGPGGWFGYTKGTDACDASDPDNTVPLLTSLDGTNYTIGDVSVFGASPPGVSLTAVTVCRAGAPLAFVCDDAGANPVYAPGATNGCGGANWFAQAAEHARKTIWYLHNFAPPVFAY